MEKQALRRSLIALTVAFTALFSASCTKQETSAVNPEGDLPYQKLVLYMPSNGRQEDNDLVEAEINRRLMEELNAEISLDWTDFSTYYSKLPLRLQSGEQLDLIWIDSNNYVSQLSQNNLMELTGLLEKYGQGITDNMPEVLMEGAKVNGSIYAVPVNKENGTNFAMYFRKDIIDKYDIDLSASDSYETFEQNVLKVVKENEPELAPFFRARGSIAIKLKDTPEETLEEHLRYEPIYGLDMVVIDAFTGKAVCAYETDKQLAEYKAYERWHNLGYFNPDAEVVISNEQEAIREGVAWSTVTTGKPGVTGDLKALLGMEMVKGYETPVLLDGNATWGSMNAIPVSSADPVRAMMVLNLLHTDTELVNLFVNGIEGVHYVKAGESAEGRTIVKLPEGVKSRSDSSYYPSTDWIIGNLFNDYLWDSDDEHRFENLKEYSRTAIKPKTFGFVFSPNEVSNQIAVLKNIVTEYEHLLNTGALNTDTAIPELLDRLYANGLSDVLEEVQRQYDLWKLMQ